ncbi:follicle cell protein 3C-1 [Adelges cooleyi]|uniref:follicle cell protein 3C-1 n=1 Tax=Adelges cooleyi TaxID=133065 RepID=UPI0021807806|nr:follicle cell protein 3C-1 [Adelges cooleyi]
MSLPVAVVVAAVGSLVMCTALDLPETKSSRKLNDLLSHGQNAQSLQAPSSQVPVTATITPCTCGVFLSSQFTKGSGKQPSGYAALMHEQDEPATCNALGIKTCTNRCLDIIAKYLPNSSAIICGSVDRDVYKERAHLFVKNCNDLWVNTNLSAGREYCCKDGHHYKCPLI